MQLRKIALLALLCVTLACGGSGPSPAGESAASDDGDGATPAAAEAASAEPSTTTGDHEGHQHAGETAPAAVEKNFPDLEYLAQIPDAYRTANEHPDLLSRIPCYCPCELYGHGGLIDCYRSQHAAACATCLEEAVLAGQLIDEVGGDESQYEAVAAQVKNRYRTAIVRSYAQRNEMPNLRSQGGNAYLQVCSDCHQPPHPAMYTPDSWRQPLARMETYARQRGQEPDPQLWRQAVEYIRSTAGQFPPEAGQQYRDQLAQAVANLKVAEGDSVYYPSARDALLRPAWFERMVRAYRLARDIPAEALAAVPIDEPYCSNLLECLNSSAAVTSEAAVAAVERLAEERGVGN